MLSQCGFGGEGSGFHEQPAHSDAGFEPVPAEAPPDVHQPIMLASGQRYPSAIAVDGSNVYWINLGIDDTTNTKAPKPWHSGAVMKCAIRGCNQLPTPLATRRGTSPNTRLPQALAADGTYVYWSDLEDPTYGDWVFGIFRCAAHGCNDEPERIMPWAASGIAIHKQRLFWTGGSGEASSCRVTGCQVPAQTYYGQDSALSFGIAVDDSGVYWIGAPRDQLFHSRQDAGGGSATRLNPLDTYTAGLYQLAIDSRQVYFADSSPIGLGKILRCPKTGCDGEPTVLAAGLSSVSAIASDGDDVFWVEAGEKVVDDHIERGRGYLRKCAGLSSLCEPTTLANGANTLAVDSHFVYWTTGSGEVWMAPK